MFRKGFTLIELLVVIAILGLLAAVLFPVFAKVRENGRRTACLSNMRQITIALTEYAQDNDSFFPLTVTREGDWASAVFRYGPAKSVFRCPSCPVPDGWDFAFPKLTAKGYALNAALYDTSEDNLALPLGRVRFPATTISLCEASYQAGPQNAEMMFPSALMGPDDGTELLKGQSFIGIAGASRHTGGSNYTFVDGHTHWYYSQQVSRTNLSRTKQGDGTRPSFAL
jgi:prepilin-type N-terminal cleavage/methylation domain-containing protein/prepilin-type processing-associated H-X9-DG protein